MRTMNLAGLACIGKLALGCGQVDPPPPDGGGNSAYELRYGHEEARHVSVVFRDLQRDVCVVFTFEQLYSAPPPSAAGFRVRSPRAYTGTVSVRCRGAQQCGGAPSSCEDAQTAEGFVDWREPPSTARGDVRITFANPRFGPAEERLRFDSATVIGY